MSPLPKASPSSQDSPSRPAGARRVDARRNREAVLQAADRLLSERGWDAAMSEIAAAAGVGVGTVYRHFPTQQVLLGTLLSRRFEAATEKVKAVVAEEGPAFERLGRALLIGAEDVATDPLTRLATRGNGALAWEHAQPARLRFDDAFASLVAEAVAEGSLRPDFAAEDVGMVMAALCATVVDSRPERWKHFFAIAVDGLRAR